MNMEPYGSTIFCDDIRNEVSGKLTLVGCYSGVMNFNNPAPATLPTFAMLLNIKVPITVKFEKIRIIVLKEEGDEVSEIFSIETEIKQSVGDNEKGINTDDKENEKFISLTVPHKWSPFHIKNSGFIKVRAYLDEGLEIKAGALKVNFASESDSTD